VPAGPRFRTSGRTGRARLYPRRSFLPAHLPFSVGTASNDCQPSSLAQQWTSPRCQIHSRCQPCTPVYRQVLSDSVITPSMRLLAGWDLARNGTWKSGALASSPLPSAGGAGGRYRGSARDAADPHIGRCPRASCERNGPRLRRGTTPYRPPSNIGKGFDGTHRPAERCPRRTYHPCRTVPALF